jgi:VPS62-like protein
LTRTVRSGDDHPISTTHELLERHKPFLKYDSQESYFADSAAEWTDNPGNRLARADGTVLATAENGLGLGFLGPTYTPNAAAAKSDVIGNPSRDYRNQARRLHQLPGYANHVYGHAVVDTAGDLWLQYWFFYFYNDYNLIGAFLHAGLHEGDWEMIQLRLRDETPGLAVFCQHAGATKRDWREVDRIPGSERPIVYVARGSHASYFEPGTHWTGHWFDHADGKRRSPELALDIVDDGDDKWRWMRWPGYWGDTKTTGNPLDSNSPRGPGAHSQWDDPLVLIKKAAELEAARLPRPTLPPPPHVRPEWAGGHVRVLYEVQPAPGGRRPTGLAVTINSVEEAAPPTTEAFRITDATGSVTLSAAVDPARPYDLYASAATADGLASESVRAAVSPAN